MSYCRFGNDSDVYIYSTGKYLVCDTCKIKGGKSFATLRYSRMSVHLESHVANGDRVPKNVLEELALSFVLGDDVVNISKLN
jgi:hypothetical protein